MKVVVFDVMHLLQFLRKEYFDLFFNLCKYVC